MELHDIVATWLEQNRPDYEVSDSAEPICWFIRKKGISHGAHFAPIAHIWDVPTFGYKVPFVQVWIPQPPSYTSVCEVVDSIDPAFWCKLAVNIQKANSNERKFLQR